MKRFLKFFGAFFIFGILVIVILAWFASEELPKGDTGPEADSLAYKMLNALNYEAYQNTRFLEWSYQGGKNQFKWDKSNGLVTVKWDDDVRVELNLNNLKNSKVFRNGAPEVAKKKQKLIDKALKNFNNDSFWLVAPYKVFDKGTQRSIVTLEDGNHGLLVTYSSGGTTPGDSYLWILNENGFPIAYKMWVSIIPIGGLEASWDEWLVTKSGAYLPKSHKLGPVNLSMGDVKGYN
ncbi:hypothetical protein [Flagellimonas meridianipacifica]|uniref:Uncharacterized protein n=1 Tax=Flagellimonas meridianipacifica TaxID=1080225 RepID=A0A2T0MBA5_9FLAO|nr:hypothetical protein [Allomuricauda pacifica]PRX54755.1 hypothetical protein CLV81_3159 [Allomuricauda pacifica]